MRMELNYHQKRVFATLLYNALISPDCIGTVRLQTGVQLFSFSRLQEKIKGTDLPDTVVGGGKCVVKFVQSTA